MNLIHIVKKILVEETNEKIRKGVFSYLDSISRSKPYYNLRTRDGIYDIHLFMSNRQITLGYYSESNKSYIYQGQYPLLHFDEDSFMFIETFIHIFGNKRIPLIFEWINANLTDSQNDSNFKLRFETPKTYLVGTWKGFHMLPRDENSKGIFVFDIK